MSLTSKLTPIHEQMQLNKQAFKKNKQNINILNNHTQHSIKSNTDLKQIKSILKDNLKSLSTHKTTSTQAYECVIKQLKLLLKQAWTKNQFLYKDRAQVLIENNRLKQHIEELKVELQESKRVLCEMRLNGYSGGEVNGVYGNGNIFNTIELQFQQQLIQTQHQQQLVSQQDCYNMDSKTYQQYQKRDAYNNQKGNANFNSKEKSQPLSEEESMLLRQGSQEGLETQVLNIGGNNNNNNNKNNNTKPIGLNLHLNNTNNNILSPSVDHQYYQSSSPSQINQTPNYNFRQANFQIQQFNKVPGHFIDIGSEFISYANSHNNSGSLKQSVQGSNERRMNNANNNNNKKGDINNTNNINNNKGRRIQISLNNTESKQLYIPVGNNTNTQLNYGNNNNNNNKFSTSQQYEKQQQQNKISKIDLHLPIDENKVILKQQIQTFKEHLRNVANDSNSKSNNESNDSQIYQKVIDNNKNKKYHCQLEQSGNNNNVKDSKNNNNNINANASHSNKSNTTQQQQPYGLKTQQCIATCSSTCQQGIFRAFYLSLLRFPLYRSKILFLLHQLQNDQSFTLYKPYPRNDFWVGLLGSFLQMINACKQSPQYILDHLNRFKLIDTLMIQALKSRVEYLYNDFGNTENGEELLDQSSLLNGSVSNNINNYYGNNNNVSNNNNNSNQLPVSNTNLQSMNVSLQNITQFQQQQQTTRQPTSTTQQYLQIFNALANSFDINCQSNNKCFQFYNSSQVYDLTNPTPQFIIQNNQEMNSFVFGFGLYYEKSEQNTISREFVNMNNGMEFANMSNDQHEMYYEYENSVKRQFEDININLPQSSTQRNNNNLNSNNHHQMNQQSNYRMNQPSNLLNSGQHFFTLKSNNKSKNNRYANVNSNNNKNKNMNTNSNSKSKSNTKTKNFHLQYQQQQYQYQQQQQQQGSFISQTNQYQQDEYEYQDQQYNQYKHDNHQIVSENISYRFNQTTQQTTMVIKSLRNSQQYNYNDNQNDGDDYDDDCIQYQQYRYQQYQQQQQQQQQQRRPYQLRQRTSFNNQYSNYLHQPIEQQLLQTQSKQLLLSNINHSNNNNRNRLNNNNRNNNLNNNSSSKSPINNNMLSKFSSIHIQPSQSKESSQVFSRMKLINSNVNNNNINNNISNKQNHRYKQQLHSPSLYDEDYIRRKVNSVESDYQDSPLQQSIGYYDDDQE